MINKGIILAGGTGSKLSPSTKIINKHILPVYNKPMIYYPLQTLIDTGIKDIMIVAGKGFSGDFLELLGSGEEFGVNLTYTVQEKAGGIAEALGLCKKFAKGENIAVILGDNFFENRFKFNDFREGARIYLKRVSDAQRFGVARVGYDPKNEKNKIIEIIEKPRFEDSDNGLIDKNGWGFAVTGLYLYDSRVFDIIGCLKPSERGELEITDVNNTYIKEDRMDFDMVEGFWSDSGTFESLFKSSSFIRSKINKT